MALGDDYISKEDLKERLKVGDTEDDTLFDIAVSASTDGINHHCRRQFQKAATATARTYRPTHSGLVIVADFHDVDDLVVKTDADGDGVYETTWSQSDYELEPADGIVDGVEGFPFWKIRAVGSLQFPEVLRRSVQITTPWGWADVPAGVVSAAYIIAEDVARLKDTAFGVGGYSEYGRIRARENPHAAMELKPFRRNVVRIA